MAWPHRFAARGEHVTQRAPRVDAAATGRPQPQGGAGRGAWMQGSDELGKMCPFGCGQVGDIAVAQYLGVVRRDPKSRRISARFGGAGGIQRSDAGATWLLCPLWCAAGHRSPEPALEHQVVAGDVVRAAAQGRATRPVHLPRVGEIHLTQCPRVRFDRIRHHWQPRDREGMRESRDPDERVADVRRH